MLSDAVVQTVRVTRQSSDNSMTGKPPPGQLGPLPKKSQTATAIETLHGSKLTLAQRFGDDLVGKRLVDAIFESYQAVG